jgi:hypothetical protein
MIERRGVRWMFIYALLIALSIASISLASCPLLTHSDPDTQREFQNLCQQISNPISSNAAISTATITNLQIGSYAAYAILYSSTVCTTAGTTTISHTFQTTSTALTITPKRSTSRIEIDAFGEMDTTNGNLASPMVSLFRNSTNLADTTNNSFCVLDAASAIASRGMCSAHIIDIPNLTSSITYAIKLNSSDGVTQVGWNDFGNLTSCITVKEWSY